VTAITTPVRTAWSARGWAIYLGWTVITLDGSALNLALPSIAEELHAPPGGISWVVDAYTLPLASLLLLGGSLGDRLGAERLFRIGAIGFAAASVACALSPTMGLLIACRAAQGVFAALLLPMVLALVGKSFDDPRQRSTAVNLMTLFGGAGMAVGPFLGGLLTDTTGRRAVFWLTAPVAIVAAVLVGTAAHPRSMRSRPRFDLAGQLIGTAGLVAVVAGLIEAGRDAGLALTGTLLLTGLALLAAFVLVEHRSRAPMMPLGVFRAPGFTPAVLGGFAFQFGAYGLQFFLALYVQSAWGVSALTGGLLLASFAVGTILASVFANPHLLACGSRQTILIGPPARRSARTRQASHRASTTPADRWASPSKSQS
jgi:MFS family permease